MAPSAIHTSNTNSASHPSGSALCSATELISQQYDYVIIGGGTAGLVVAARLTEDPNIKVAVIEAGKNRMDDKKISTPSNYPQLIGRPEYDWMMQSVPQPAAGNKTYSMPRGKVLGGSSAINYLMYVRGSRKDYDLWASLAGSDEWTWERMIPYFRKHQTLDPPDSSYRSPDPQIMPHAEIEKYHGNSGPIHTSFNDYRMPLEDDFCKAALEVTGTKNTLVDAWSGDHLGFYSSLGAVDRTDDKGNRSYAATGYLRPNLGRPNLKVLTEALASKVLLEEGGIGGPRATGVEFIHDGKRHQVKASREVILSAGAVQSPQLLELSGIGDPEVLSSVGINCIVENKSVGANFQDHVLGGMLFECADGILSMDALHGAEYQAAQQKMYDETQKGPYGSPGMCMGFVSYASIVSPEEHKEILSSIRENSLAKTPFEKKEEQGIVDQLSDPTFANLQAFCIPCQLDTSSGGDQVGFFSKPPEGKNRISLILCLEHPLSRGSVHITSSDPTKTPQIDPGYFRNEADVRIFAAGLRWLDKVSQVPILKKSLGERVTPPANASLETEEERMDFARNHISTQYHLIGTAALGEVVDARLRVKGVSGLRVVDASIFPSHISGNIMSSTYAVAEKGADLIKEDASK
ncbi:GMC oxidoreductase [Viridothelium virens]|uniref:GMC oxidoreductase n=1 Tax=Viridothelium virens TaxID=1048519 RepID=A0A6A6H8Q4_VIRVR|nr:GMC oxidoreductase [Viridothelium virens]